MSAEARPQVNQKAYIGAETAVGVAVGATKSLPSLMLDIQKQFRNQFYRRQGSITPTSGVRHRTWAGGTYEGGLDYEEIAYLFSSLFGEPTPTNPATGVYVRSYAPGVGDFGEPQSYTCRYGDALASMLVPGVHFNSFDLAITEQEAKVSGNIAGREVDEAAGPIDATTDEVAQVALTNTIGGTFTLTFGAQTTTNIPWNTSAQPVEDALIALSTIGAGEVGCYGGPLPEIPVTVHFREGLGGTNVGAITITTTGLIGGDAVAQVETAVIVGTITTSGNAEVVVTAAGLTGSPITLSVAVLEDDTASEVATKIRAELEADTDIDAFFVVGGTGANVVLTARAFAANDGTMNIAYDNDTCAGLTPDATSNNTTAGSVGTPSGAVTVLQAGAAAYSDIPQVPVSISEVDVYIDEEFADIGTTKFCEAKEINLTWPDFRALDFRLCTDVQSWKELVIQALEGMTGRITLVKTTDVIALIDALDQKQKPTWYVRIDFVGPEIATGYDYQFQLDLAVQIREPVDRKDVEGAVYAHEFDFQVVGSTDMGGPLQALIRNTRATL